MKLPLSEIQLPRQSLLITCSSHEKRCLGFTRQLGDWSPSRTILFQYSEANLLGKKHHATLLSAFGPQDTIVEVPFEENHVIDNFNAHKKKLNSILHLHDKTSIVIDVSVLTKRHLLLLLRWLDDHACWDRLWIVYSEPEEYEIEGNLPLSFGVSSVQQLPGFSSSPNPSRPLHVAMFLGYEGDRAFATYEILQPQKTTVIIPDPPFKEEWKGRTEELNKNLLSAISMCSMERADSIDPEASEKILCTVFGKTDQYSTFNRALCPLGTKPQTIGAYLYLRACCDTPAVIYSRALRHNHSFYSRGIGTTWLIHQPR